MRSPSCASRWRRGRRRRRPAPVRCSRWPAAARAASRRSGSPRSPPARARARGPAPLPRSPAPASRFLPRGRVARTTRPVHPRRGARSCPTPVPWPAWPARSAVWIVASNVAPITSGNCPWRCNIPLSGVHHIRRLPRLRTAPANPRSTASTHSAPSGPAPPAPRSAPGGAHSASRRFVGEPRDRAQLLRTQHTLVRRGGDLGQRLQSPRSLDLVAHGPRRLAVDRRAVGSIRPRSSSTRTIASSSTRRRAARRSSRRAVAPTDPSASTATRRDDRRCRTCSDQNTGV